MDASSQLTGDHPKHVSSFSRFITSIVSGTRLSHPYAVKAARRALHPKSSLARHDKRSSFNAAPCATMAWLVADPAPSPWYATFGAVLVLCGLAFGLIRPFVVRARQHRRNQPKPLRIRWQGSPETFEPQPYHWALATALVFSVRNGSAWDSLALDAPPEETRVSLRQSWGISDRASLLQELAGLLMTGHREHLQALVNHAATLSPAGFEQQCEQWRASQRSDGEKRELLWQMRAARDNLDDVQKQDFLAWDMVRFIMLCQNGLLLGYLNEAEARDFVLLPSILMQRRYSSWLDCADQFMRARNFWAGGDPAMRLTQEATRQTIALLQKDPRSPWKFLAWDAALPSPTHLFARTLAHMNLITPLTEHERLNANPIALQLDDGLPR